MQPSLLRRTPGRVLAAVAGLLLAPSMLVVAGAPQQAWAEENRAIEFSDLKLEETNNDGVVINDGKLDIGSRVKLSVNYDASRAKAKPGDSFKILAPAYMQLREEGTFPMKAADGTAAGSCVLKLLPGPSGQPWYKNVPEITCTFGEAIKGMHDVAGTVEVGMIVDDISDSGTAEITINGKGHPVPLPYGKEIKPTVFTPGSGVGKWAGTPNRNSKDIRWTIYAGGPWLTKNFRPGETVTITDRLGPGHQLATVTGGRAPAVLSEICPDPKVPHGYSSVNVAQVNKELGKGFTLAMQENADKTAMTIQYSGSFKKECNYNLSYDTTFPGGAPITLGQSYENSGEFVGKARTFTAKAHYVQTFDATIRYRKGFGSFKVVKLVSGSGFPADQKFDVTISYELPEGRTAADYPGWNAPSNPTKYTVAVGIGTTYEETFPEGTKVTLVEEVISANPAPETGIWGEYRFASTEQGVTLGQDGRSATFTIVDQKALALELTNTWLPKEFAPFKVTKTVVPAGVAAGGEFPVGYECDSMGNRNTPASGKVTIRPGQETTVGEFPIGTTCRIVSEDDVTVAEHTLASKDLGKPVVIAKDGSNTVTVTNTYQPNTPPSTPQPSAPPSTPQPSAPPSTPQPSAPLVSIGDRVWVDEDRDGQQDQGERPVAGVRVILKDGQGMVVGETRTDENGWYNFNDLKPSTEYRLLFTLPAGTSWTTANQGDDATDSDVDPNGEVRFTTPTDGKNEIGPGKADDPTLDAGVVIPVPEQRIPMKPQPPTTRPGLPSTGC